MIYSIIDIETTGNGIKGNKITEIAILKLDGDRIIDEFSSLVNPECPIPQFITGLTGIDDQMVAQSPTFSELAEKIHSLTQNTIFVAHAVNFDYGVLKEEFRRIGTHFDRKKLCTVRLSRRLIPGLQSYSLGKLCSALKIPLKNRHRAYGDAHATMLLFKKLLKQPQAQQTIQNFLNARSQEATLPPLLAKEEVARLPEKPGIYYFKNRLGTIIYVGKAINIKKRVLGHFYDKSGKEVRMCREIAAIDFELSGSELLALLMESVAIKKHFPIFNSAQKRVPKAYALFSYEDRKGYLHLAHAPLKMVHSPIKTFHRQSDCTAFLHELCTTYQLCAKYCTLRKVPCDEISSCSAKACTGIEDPLAYNKRVIQAVEQSQKTNSTIFIKEKGRNEREDALISFVNGAYQGYGFIGREIKVHSIEDIDAFLIPQKNTADTDSIITGYLLRNKAASFYEYESSTNHNDAING